MEGLRNLGWRRLGLQDVHAVSLSVFSLSLSGLLRDGLLPVPESVPARRPTCVLRAGGGP